MIQQAAFVYADTLMNYRFNDQHPFNQKRLKLTLDLLTSAGLISHDDIIPPAVASDHDISLFHDKGYIDAVKQAGEGDITNTSAENYGLGTEDTPIFPGMHDASAAIVGATLTAAEAVMKGRYHHAVNLSGGLHHGFQGKASGFCIYNDSAIVIKYLREKYGVRVLYIDTDAHHGDGVQWAFYDDPDVCTVSIHETGRYLFPGTGDIHERGYSQAYGTSFNIPIDAFTEDDSWLELYDEAIERIADVFKPDIILSQHGVDAHVYDPLTHLCLTMKSYRSIPHLAHKLAHKYCDGRWIAIGGGGYDIWRVVPRAWSMIWAEMSGQLLPIGNIPKDWIKQWQPYSVEKLPEKWEDAPDICPNIPRRNEICHKNRQTLKKALNVIRLEQKARHN